MFKEKQNIFQKPFLVSIPLKMWKDTVFKKTQLILQENCYKTLYAKKNINCLRSKIALYTNKFELTINFL